MNWLPSVVSVPELPAGAARGDCCYVESTGESWVYDRRWYLLSTSKPPGGLTLLVTPLGQEPQTQQDFRNQVPDTKPQRKIEP